MCGISGVFSVDEKIHVKLKQNIGIQRHRGPDFEKYELINPSVSLLHSRLAIVDLNSRSNQPFHDPKTGNTLVFNGEIFNYEELKELIPNRDFTTTSDTEVLLYLLSDRDVADSLSKCNGMFAFAFWDNSKQELIIGRDRFGQKPLFYYYDGKSLAFASEAKALLPFLPEKKVNHEAVINYIFEITIGKNEQSFFKDIVQVKNGTFKTFRLDGKNVVEKSTESYWWYPLKKSKISYDDAVIKFKDLLKDAIQLRLSDEVDYAVMLSGGLDSSTISAFAAKYNPTKKITSISAVYPDDKKDESHFARMVTDKYQNLSPVWIDNIDHNKFQENIEKVIYHLECPLADGSLIAQYLLMKKISELGIKVILSGNGGDEILAGYPAIFFPASNVENIRSGKLKKYEARTFFHLLPLPLKNYIYKLKHKKLGFLKDNSILDSFWTRFKDHKTDDFLNNYLINGLEHWTLPNLMWYEDRNSMASSIESRCPLLDYRIVEFIMSLPSSYKIDEKFTKKILRDSTRGIVPEEILQRTDKQGFHAPNDKWVEYIDKSFLTDEAFTKEFAYLDFGKIKDAPFRTFWRTYTLYVWYNVFFVNKSN